MTTPQSSATRRPYRGIGAALLIVACAAACALPVLGGLIAGTFVDRFLDVPTWAVALIVVATGAFLVARRRGAPHGC